MVLRLLPDIEALCVDFLDSHASITAMVGSRVSPELPAGPTFPYLTLSLITGDEIVGEHFDSSLIQLAAWGDTKTSASLLIRTARAVMLTAPDADHARGVVTAVRTVVAPRWVPDDSVAPPKPRYLADLRVWHHPHLL